MYLLTAWSSAFVSCAFAVSASVLSFAAFAALCSSVNGGAGGSFATATPNAPTTSAAPSRARIVVCIDRLRVRTAIRLARCRAGWHQRHRRIVGGRWNLAGLDVVVPVQVMFLRPGLVDVALAHRLVSGGHTDRAHVDVPECREHEERCDAEMHDIGDLHRVARLVEVRE